MVKSGIIVLITIILLSLYFNVYSTINQNFISKKGYTICGNPQQTRCNLIPKYYPIQNNVSCVDNYQPFKCNNCINPSNVTRCTNNDFIISKLGMDESFINKFETTFYSPKDIRYQGKWVWSTSTNYKIYNNHFSNYLPVYLMIFMSVIDLIIFVTYCVILSNEDVSKVWFMKIGFMCIFFFTTVVIPMIIKLSVNWNTNDSKNFVNIGIAQQTLEKSEIGMFTHFCIFAFIFIYEILNNIDCCVFEELESENLKKVEPTKNLKKS